MSTPWTPDYGDISASAPTWPAQKPVRIALLGNFSGSAANGKLGTGSSLGSRKAIPVEFDTLEDLMGRLNVNLTLQVDDTLQTTVPITDLESFHPDQLYQTVEVFAELASLRKQLNNPATYAKAASKIQSWSGQKKRKASQAARTRRGRGGAPAADAKLSDFARLVGDAANAVNTASTCQVNDLVQRIVGPFIVPADSPDKAKLLSALDTALADAMRTVLHHPDFQTMESLWRGVDLLLRRLETGPQLQVHLIDISAEEFAADLSSQDDLSDTGLYKLLVDRASQDKTGGYTYVAGLFRFEASPPHTELLGRMAKIAQHAGATFLTEMNADDLLDRKKPPHALVQSALQSLKAMPEASNLALFGPQFMLRHPYGKRTDPISSFDFEEFSLNVGLGGMLWGHPSLLALTALAGQSGHIIGDLPFHHYKDADGDTIALPCTDRLIKQDQASALQTWGITALMAHKGAPELHLTRLAAVNGDALGKATPTSSKSRSDVQTKIEVGAKLSVSATSASKGTSNPKQKPPSDDDELDLDDLLSDSSDSDLDSSFGASSNDDADDLDALLASLGGDNDQTSATDDDVPSGDDEMDPELAALLASLE